MVLATPVKSQYIADFFCNPTITYLGKISFTVYLWQQLATSADYIKNPWLNLAALAGTVVIGILSYRYFERPFIRLGSAYSRKIKVPVATAQQFDKVLD
jgi:peptidoglycan/LPS O-acetylase OafA/YrhL